MSEKKEQKLNLPKTEIPMKANLNEREPKMLEEWSKRDVYQKIRKHNSGKEKFILHDGPPYANGKIHIGHAVNKVLKDIVIRSKSLEGFDAPYVPGWDCHGLPIELQVEKKLGKKRRELSQSEFRAMCRKYAKEQIDIQKDDFIRLGVFGDWENRYASLDYSFEGEAINGFARIYHNGHVEKGSKPVHWCLECSSALAEAEVEYMDKTSSSIDVKFAYTVKSSDGEGRFVQLVALKSDRNGLSAMQGDVVTDANQGFGQLGASAEVSMSMNAEGAKQWKRLTAENIGKSIAIVLDGYVYSFPTVQ